MPAPPAGEMVVSSFCLEKVAICSCLSPKSPGTAYQFSDGNIKVLDKHSEVSLAKEYIYCCRSRCKSPGYWALFLVSIQRSSPHREKGGKLCWYSCAAIPQHTKQSGYTNLSQSPFWAGNHSIYADSLIKRCHHQSTLFRPIAVG